MNERDREKERVVSKVGKRECKWRCKRWKNEKEEPRWTSLEASALNYIFNCDFLAQHSSFPSACQRAPPDDKNKRETVFCRRRRRRLPSPPRISYTVTPSATVSAYRAPSPTLSLPAYSFPRTGANFCPLPRRAVPRLLSSFSSYRSPPLSSVQQVARSFKTCRRSFVRFKKPKHQQSSALRRQDRYPHREQSSEVVGGRKMR